MADIGELVVRIKADAAQLEREMARANGIVRNSSNEMGDSMGKLKAQFMELLPALSVAALAEFGKRAVEAADHINDLALRTGFAGDTLSALNIPLKQSGSSLDEFSASMNRMNNLIGEAAKGANQEAIKAFDDLGLSVRKLQALSPEEQFFAIAEALGSMDNQSKMTNAGMAIFGRSFASIIPLIKESKGHLREFTDAAKGTVDAISPEALDRIDKFGDALTKAVERAKNSFAEAFAWILKVADAAQENWDFGGDFKTNPNVSRDRPTTIGGPSGDLIGPMPYDPFGKSRSAKGSNAGLLKGGDDLKGQAEDYDKLSGSVDEYLRKLQMENSLLAMNEKEREGMRAVYDAQTLAMKDNDSLTLEQIEQIKSLAQANSDLKNSMEESSRFSKELKDNFSDALSDIVTHFDSAGDAARRFFENIASMIIQKKITGPLSDSLLGSSSGGKGLLDGLFNMLGFADGGDPPVGVPSIVGERGPEIFVPRTAGTVIPNGAMGGTQFTLHQHINVSPGVPELIVSKIQEAAPVIAAMGRSMTFDAMQRGGNASKLVGKRS